MAGLINIGEMGALALHVVVGLAELRARNPLARATVQQLAEGFHASAHTLHKVVRRLVMAGLLEGARGANGGLRLVVPPETLTLQTVLQEVEGRLDKHGCLFSHRACDGSHPCPFQTLTGELENRILAYFTTTTVADLVKRGEGAEASMTDVLK